MTIADAPQRARAIDPLASFCVSAPAGSGKTELLIQRLLSLLARVDKPEQVLAITFTRKAAAEMRERVMQALEDAAAGAPCDSEHQALTRTLAESALAADERHQWHLLDNLSRLNIKTIDSFCASLTRQMPVLSEFGGQLGAEDNALELYAEAVRELFALLQDGHSVSSDLAALMLHFDNNWDSLQTLLVAMLARREQWRDYMGIHHEPEESEAYLTAAVSQLVADCLETAETALRPYREDLVELADMAAKHLEIEPVAVWPEPTVKDLRQWRQLADLLLTGQGSWRKSISKTMGLPQSEADVKEKSARLKDIIAALSGVEGAQACVAEIARLPAVEEGGLSWTLALHLSRVLPVLAAQLLLVFARHGRVDHSEIAQAALRALGDEQEPTDLALRLDYSVEHILVDEFQDTAINQYELVRKLTRGWSEHNSLNPQSPKTLMIVGDAMQSIYGFRDANVGLFMAAQRKGFNGVQLEHLRLSSNFRSHADIVDWVNGAFSRAFPDRDNIQLGQIRYSEATAARDLEGESQIDLRGFHGDAARAAEQEFVCARIRDHLEAGESSIAVLARTRAQLRPVARQLRAQGIPCSAQELDTLAHSVVVADMLNLGRALANRADRLSWMALLRSPWVGLTLADLLIIAGEDACEESSEDDEKARRPAAELRFVPVHRRLLDSAVREQLSSDGRRRVERLLEHLAWAEGKRDRLSLRVWIETLWKHLGGATCASGADAMRDAESFLQLLELADSEGRGLDLPWLEQQAEERYMSGGDPDGAVQLLTLHKAKGLEFDCVIIPGLAAVPRADSRDILAWDEYTNALDDRVFLLAADDRDKKAPTLYNYLQHRAKQKRLFEGARLLYVGATRAVRHLTLTAALGQDAKKGGYQAPAASSLLATIWETFERCATIAEAPLVEERAGPARTAPLRRLRTAAMPAPPAVPEESTGIGANRPERPENYLDRAVGTVVHLALEQLALRTELPAEAGAGDTERWRCELGALGLWGENLSAALARVVEAVNTTLADTPGGRWVLDSNHLQARSEWPLSVAAEDSVRSIVVDRSFVDPATQWRWIVDYKNSRPEEGESVADFCARESLHYREQLLTYRDAIRELDDRELRCALYFTAIGRLHILNDLSLPGGQTDG